MGSQRASTTSPAPPSSTGSASDQECILYGLSMTCAWQTMCCMKPGFNVHDQSHSARDSARVGRGGTQSEHRLEICAGSACHAELGRERERERERETVLKHIF